MAPLHEIALTRSTMMFGLTPIPHGRPPESPALRIVRTSLKMALKTGKTDQTPGAIGTNQPLDIDP